MRLWLCISLLLSALLAFGGPARAADELAEIPPANRVDCGEMIEPRPEDIAACYNAHAAKLSAKLDAFVEEAKAVSEVDYDYASAQYVITSQAAFETYIEQQCGYWKTVYGMGGLSLIEESACIVRLLQQRLAEFFLVLDDPDAEFDCGALETQAEMNHCAGLEFKEADDALNAAYSVAMDAARRIDTHAPPEAPSARRDLRDAQRAWIKFRDQACKVEAMLAEGGSMQPTMLALCLTRLSRAREDDLRIFGEVN